jgi:hypothetical protein
LLSFRTIVPAGKEQPLMALVWFTCINGGQWKKQTQLVDNEWM